MADRILVPFEGEDYGTAELTWGQQHIWDWIQQSGVPLSMSATRTLAEGETVDTYVDELRFFMSRFQAMRTRLGFDENGRPQQVVARSGEVSLEIVDAEDGADPAEVAKEVAARHQGSHFDYANEWPVRMALVRQAGALTHLVTTLCHVVIDSAAAMVMFTDLLARDPGTGAARGPIAAMGPLELAAWQRSPSGRRQSDAALRYWEQHLRTIPTLRPASQGAAEPVFVYPDRARHWRFSYDSPATYLALRRIADRLTAETGPVLLAAFALAFARVTRHDPVVLQVIVSNRFRPGFAEIVCPVNQPGLCVLGLTDTTFDEAFAHARRRAINAYKFACYDQVQLDQLIATIERERGAEIDLGCFVNDRRTQTTMDTTSPVPTEEEVRAALPRSTLRREPLESLNKTLMLTINDATEAVAITLEADTKYLAISGLEALARGIETVAMEAALTPPALAPA